MYAVFVTGGKQYKVQQGDTLRVEKLAVEEGSSVEFNSILLVADGDTVEVGSPYVEGRKVLATVRSHGRGKKIKVVKFKRRKGYRRQMGHRQSYTELEITDISLSASS